MKIRTTLAFVLLSVVYCQAQKTGNNCDRYTTAIQIFNENSISPIQPEKIDENIFSESLIASLNPNYVFFTPDDILTFEQVGISLKSDYNGAYCNNREVIQSLYIENLKRSLTILDEFKQKPFGFSKNDSIYTGQPFNKQIFNIERKARWVSLVKYKTLQIATESATNYDSLLHLGGALNIFLDSIKLRVINREQKKVNGLLDSLKKIDDFIYFCFTNSLLNQFDEHSYLFSENAFSNFKEQLSIYTQSFGIAFEYNENGDLIISSIIPGSFAWKTGKIHVDDKILKLKTPNKDMLIIENSSTEDIVDYISNTSSKEMVITLSDQNGQEKEITLYLEETKNSNNSVQALILNGASKVGYIMLPAFYTSWDSTSTFGCSQDVGRAIYALKNEKIESLIIDLRNNGGGSVIEAIDLAGIFIDYGPITIGQNSKNELQTIKDFNRGTMYSGPLAILINSNSASASEMVTAILQDYNRAIIIGETSFGKASGQLIFPLNNSKDVLKVTTLNYYRVTGSSYSKIGVVPDISLPNINIQRNNHSKINEVKTINKKTYFTPLTPIPIVQLANKSSERVAQVEKFSEIKQIDDIINSSVFSSNYLYLNINFFFQLAQKKEVLFNRISSIKNSSSTIYKVDYLKSDKELIQLYKYYADLLSDLSKSVNADPYIEETYNILMDIKNLK